MKLCINAELFELIANNPNVEQAGVYWNEHQKKFKATFEIKDADIIEVIFRDNVQKLKDKEA
jgi:hypothetical protein